MYKIVHTYLTIYMLNKAYFACLFSNSFVTDFLYSVHNFFFCISLFGLLNILEKRPICAMFGFCNFFLMSCLVSYVCVKKTKENSAFHTRLSKKTKKQSNPTTS